MNAGRELLSVMGNCPAALPYSKGGKEGGMVVARVDITRSASIA
jgi:hypothetical protein